MARPKHGYALPDGTPVVGVTTVAKYCDTGNALVGWAGKRCTAYAWRAGIDAARAHANGEPMSGMPKWGDILYKERDDAAVAGTIGHEMSQAWLRGEDPEAAAQAVQGARDVLIDAGRRAFESFQEWWDGQSFTVVAMEEPLVSPSFEFGGTYDLLLERDGEYHLGDLKTGGTYPSHLLQVAAYRQLLSEVRGTPVVRCHLLRITRDTNTDFHHHSFAANDLDDEWNAFVLCLRLHGLMQSIMKRAK